MERVELIKRIEELQHRSEQKNCVTSSLFLTPAEQYEIRNTCALLKGGGDDNERKVAFFLPDYMCEDDLEIDNYISSVKIQAYFGAPEHRDYMGAILGLGIKREWVGDIMVCEDCAYVFCLPSIVKTLCEDLNKVGRITVKTTEIKLDEVPTIERKVIEKTFTIKSTRFDAMTADMFSMSRNNAAELIKSGLVSLNYEICDKVDSTIREGDVISVRGKGKGTVSKIGGKTKKDRTVITALLFK